MRIEYYLLLILFNLYALVFRAEAQESTSVVYRFKDNNSEKKMYLFFDSLQSSCIYNRSDLDENSDQNRMNITSGAKVSMSIKQYDSVGLIIYRNFSEQLLLIRYPKVASLSPFLVEDKWTDLDWAISKKKKKIMGYACTKATTKFRGREYVAWFTTDLPYSFGPWKLFGLPGLILYAHDETKMFEWSADSIRKNVSAPIVRPYEDSVKSLEEYVFYLDNQLELIYDGVKANVAKKNATLPSGNQISITDFQRYTSVSWGRNRSLEVDYEFEKDRNKSMRSEASLPAGTDTSRSIYYNYDR